MEKDVADPAIFARGLVYGSPIIDQVWSRGGVEPEQIIAAMVQNIGAKWRQTLLR